MKIFLPIVVGCLLVSTSAYGGGNLFSDFVCSKEDGEAFGPEDTVLNHELLNLAYVMAPPNHSYLDGAAMTAVAKDAINAGDGCVMEYHALVDLLSNQSSFEMGTDGVREGNFEYQPVFYDRESGIQLKVHNAGGFLVTAFGYESKGADLVESSLETAMQTLETIIKTTGLTAKRLFSPSRPFSHGPGHLRLVHRTSGYFIGGTEGKDEAKMSYIISDFAKSVASGQNVDLE